MRARTVSSVGRLVQLTLAASGYRRRAGRNRAIAGIFSLQKPTLFPFLQRRWCTGGRPAARRTLRPGVCAAGHVVNGFAFCRGRLRGAGCRGLCRLRQRNRQATDSTTPQRNEFFDRRFPAPVSVPKTIRRDDQWCVRVVKPL
ncbi:hypothetical protein KCP77_00380 [Salmonella enterica subsp. enterica]|nr:hypothetical protein KCP77_00380 [Salmonella enterica subsp. enterica]